MKVLLLIFFAFFFIQWILGAFWIHRHWDECILNNRGRAIFTVTYAITGMVLIGLNAWALLA